MTCNLISYYCTAAYLEQKYIEVASARKARPKYFPTTIPVYKRRPFVVPKPPGLPPLPPDLDLQGEEELDKQPAHPPGPPPLSGKQKPKAPEPPKPIPPVERKVPALPAIVDLSEYEDPNSFDAPGEKEGVAFLKRIHTEEYRLVWEEMLLRPVGKPAATMYAAEALGQIGNSDSIPLLEKLFEVQPDDRSGHLSLLCANLANSALYGLSLYHSPEAFNAIGRCMSKEMYEPDRKKYLEGLAVDTLLTDQLLTSPKLAQESRKLAAEILAWRRDPKNAAETYLLLAVEQKLAIATRPKPRRPEYYLWFPKEQQEQQKAIWKEWRWICEHRQPYRPGFRVMKKLDLERILTKRSWEQ